MDREGRARTCDAALQCEPGGGTGASLSRLSRQATLRLTRSAAGSPPGETSLSRTSETTAAGILADPSRPVIDRGIVFVVGHGGRMIAVSESSGERLWTRNVTSTQMPWSAGDAVFVVDVNGKLMALARADGKVRWISQLPGKARWNGPVLAGGKLWVGIDRGLARGRGCEKRPGRPARPRSARRCSSLPLWPAAACISWPTTPC